MFDKHLKVRYDALARKKEEELAAAAAKKAKEEARTFRMRSYFDLPLT